MILSISALFSRYRNLILYCLIGCVGASLDFAVFFFLNSCCGWHHQFANIISISCGILTNFFLNYFFNFKSQGKLFFRLVSFYLIGMFGMGISAVLLWCLIDCFAIHALPAKFLTIFLVVIVQYTLNKTISFRKGKTSC